MFFMIGLALFIIFMLLSIAPIFTMNNIPPPTKLDLLKAQEDKSSY
jgi:hypothetical protein